MSTTIIYNFSLLYTDLALQPRHLLLLPLITTLPFLSCEFLVDADDILDSLCPNNNMKCYHSYVLKSNKLNAINYA